MNPHKIEGETTTIKIGKTTTSRLRNIGKKGETYDDVVNNLIDAHNALEKIEVVLHD